jgi:hypothetical protein
VVHAEGANKRISLDSDIKQQSTSPKTSERMGRWDAIGVCEAAALTSCTHAVSLARGFFLGSPATSTIAGCRASCKGEASVVTEIPEISPPSGKNMRCCKQRDFRLDMCLKEKGLQNQVVGRDKTVFCRRKDDCNHCIALSVSPFLSLSLDPVTLGHSLQCTADARHRKSFKPPVDFLCGKGDHRLRSTSDLEKISGDK